MDGLFYKLTFLKFPAYIVHTISFYLRDGTIEASFQMATTSRRDMRDGVAQGRLNSTVPIQSVYQLHAPTLLPHPAGPLLGRRDHYSHVPQAEFTCKITGLITQRPLKLVE